MPLATNVIRLLYNIRHMAKRAGNIGVANKEAKALACVLEVSREGYDPSSTALAMLLRGENAVERFSYLKTYGTLTSLSAKKIKAMATGLIKKGYLSFYAPPLGAERYLLLTPKGKDAALAALSRGLTRRNNAPSSPLFMERN